MVLQSLIVMRDGIYAANILILSDNCFDKAMKHDFVSYLMTD